MTTQELLNGVALAHALPAAVAGAEVRGLEYDSRRVGDGYLFFAFSGAKLDGARFAAQARAKGALAVVSESLAPPGFDGAWIQVRHGREALARCARRFHGQPDEQVAVTGVTGTNGKTTTAFVVDAMLRALGRTTAMIGTVEYRLAGQQLPAPNTTPESLDIYRILSELRQRGGTHLTMEVSSHALALGRVHGLHFHTAVFTNLTRDHLDFHGGMEEYFQAKRLLFTGLGGPAPRHAVINGDDPHANLLAPPSETRVIRYGLGEAAGLRAINVTPSFAGVRFTARWEGRDYPVRSALLGQINVYNLLAAFGVGLAHGLAPQDIADALAQAPAVPGRFERVEEGQPFLVLVDYAHTDDALRNLLQAARELKPRRVVTLFGCGGDRDRTKRPLMGGAAGQGSDHVVLTSDNPRSEDPLAIIADAEQGLKATGTPYQVEPDRARAIRLATELAGPGDIVLLAGKGHETYQVVQGQTLPFDDRDVARRVLREAGYRRTR